MTNTKISKLMSLVLRHKPESIGIKLDNNGWANVDELIVNINRMGYQIDFNLLNEIVETNDKQRFSFSEDKSRIRANQGHSVNVDVELEAATPPDILYHGTSTRFLDSILEKGLTKQSRNHVHLSSDEATALAVGRRHGTPTLLKIDAKTMVEDGIMFYKSKNGVWLTETVSSKYFL